MEDNKADLALMKADIEWAYGIFLALREGRETPDAMKNHIEAFIDHYHKIYDRDYLL